MHWKEWLETPNDQIDPDHLQRYITNLKSYHFPNKQRFREAKAELETKLRNVQKRRTQRKTEKEKDEERQNEHKLKALLTQNLPFMILKVNNRKTSIDPETLEAILSFHPCAHKETIKIYDLLYYPINSAHQWSIRLAKWQSFLGSNGELEVTRNCKECRKAIDKRYKIFHTRKANPIIGKCNVKLTKF